MLLTTPVNVWPTRRWRLQLHALTLVDSTELAFIEVHQQLERGRHQRHEWRLRTDHGLGRHEPLGDRATDRRHHSGLLHAQLSQVELRPRLIYHRLGGAQVLVRKRVLRFVEERLCLSNGVLLLLQVGNGLTSVLTPPPRRVSVAAVTSSVAGTTCVRRGLSFVKIREAGWAAADRGSFWSTRESDVTPRIERFVAA